MKKRIIAAALAAVVALNLCSLRPKAAAAAGTVIGIGVLAFNILGVMTGKYDDVANGIGFLIENGVEGWQKAFVGSDDCPSWFVSGWQQIYDKLTEWVNDYSITVSDDGKVRMKYSQYLELCGLVGNAYADVDLDLTTDYQYLMFKAEPNVYIHIDQSVSLCSVENLANGIHYAPVLYDDDNNLYFSDVTLSLKIMQMNGFLQISFVAARTNFLRENFSESNVIYSGGYSSVTMDDFYDKADIFFTTSLDPSLDLIYNGDFSSSKKSNKSCAINWYQLDEVGNLVQINDLDISSLHLAYFNVACGTYGYTGFLKSITAHSTVSTVPALDDLSDDLAPILDKTKDPTLEIDTDPSIATPADAVTVTDIPGTADVTIAQLREKTNVDIDIPSVISTKFPFCIPFDFIRIIGVLCADPVAPVFRIPISTDPENLKGFEGNQTIGELPEDFTPMFEIDEELVIDLSAVPLVQPICYTVFIISFVVLLIFSTNKMINH